MHYKRYLFVLSLSSTKDWKLSWDEWYCTKPIKNPSSIFQCVNILDVKGTRFHKFFFLAVWFTFGQVPLSWFWFYKCCQPFFKKAAQRLHVWHINQTQPSGVCLHVKLNGVEGKRWNLVHRVKLALVMLWLFIMHVLRNAQICQRG